MCLLIIYIFVFSIILNERIELVLISSTLNHFLMEVALMRELILNETKVNMDLLNDWKSVILWGYLVKMTSLQTPSFNIATKPNRADGVAFVVRWVF